MEEIEDEYKSAVEYIEDGKVRTRRWREPVQTL